MYYYILEFDLNCSYIYKIVTISLYFQVFVYPIWPLNKRFKRLVIVICHWFKFLLFGQIHRPVADVKEDEGDWECKPRDDVTRRM